MNTRSSPRAALRNSGTKSTRCLCADILGDWREEVPWRTTDNRELRIDTTTTPTDDRLTTLMHDPRHRFSVSWQNVGYNQPTQPVFSNFGQALLAQTKELMQNPQGEQRVGTLDPAVGFGGFKANAHGRRA